jgi:hypothetical protein
MAKAPPETLVLGHDKYEARYVGWTADGRQFFCTEPFVPALRGNPGREFLALYLFDKDGALLEAQIEDLGTRAGLDKKAAAARQAAQLASLGPVKYGKIKVAPFRIERFGEEFGFIPQPPEEPGGDWSVIVEPGNYMCFWPPWTSGDYDT